MKRLILFLNPIARMGLKRYTFFFPFFTCLFAAAALEFYAYRLVGDPMAVGFHAITVFFTLIIYFSFRDGILGGLTATGITIAYYLYIIESRAYQGNELVSGIETTAILGVIYVLLSVTIGWLKQKIDTLIEREVNEKNRLKTILEQLPVGVMIADNTGKVVIANNKLDEILGSKFPIGFQIGTKTLYNGSQNNKKIHPSKGPLAQILAGNKKFIENEYSITRPDKKKAFLHVRSTAIHTWDKKILAGVSIITDITNKKEQEKRKDDFINMASHELKTPLTSLKLYIETLNRRVKPHMDAKTVNVMDHIKVQTERLQKIVNELLDVSRIQTGKLTFHMEEFRLDELIEECIEIKHSVHERDIIFNKHPRIKIYADRFRLYQVFTNLINNAIKYSAPGTEISISLKKTPKNIVVSVADTGIGIPKDQQHKIFEKLYQVAGEKTSTFPGFGMGLYISKEIIKRHKGKIWVESEEGKGSTFYISLPVTKN